MRDRYQACAGVHFLCVYIREAHAIDVWPIDGPRVREPKTLEERISIAQEFKRECGLSWPVAVDGMSDAFLQAFAPWPFRFFVLREGVVDLKTTPVAGTHETDSVELYLRDFTTQGTGPHGLSGVPR